LHFEAAIYEISIGGQIHNHESFNDFVNQFCIKAFKAKFYEPQNGKGCIPKEYKYAAGQSNIIDIKQLSNLNLTII